MREIYKVAYDEVEQVVLADGDRAAADRGARRARGARHRLGDVRGRVVAAVAARGPARLVRLLAGGRRPRRRSCGCERAPRGRTRRPARRPPAAGAAVRGARGGGRGARRARVPGRSRPPGADLRGPRAVVAPRRAGRRLGSGGTSRRPRADGRPAAARPRGRAEPTLLGDDDLRSGDLRRRAGSLADGARISSPTRAPPPRRARARLRARVTRRATRGLRARGHAAVGLAEVLPRGRRAARRRGRRSCRAGRSCRA